MSGDEVRDLIRDYGTASKILPSHEITARSKLCEVLKAYLRDKAETLVKQNQGRPLLYCYGNDGTDMITQVHITVDAGPHRQLRRRGGRALEFLIEMAWVSARTAGGKWETCVLFRDPQPMTEGKKADHNFMAARRFFPMLRQLGHRGICVSYYCFDRKLQRALQRRIAAMNRMYYNHRDKQPGADKADNLLLMLSYWVLVWVWEPRRPQCS